ncbi:MAG: hypothetical protein KJ077_26450 [Anaerolineae bacterium]|nr:hypothetical protein [Anaerolineae bacterium]
MPEETFVPVVSESYYTAEADNRWAELSPKPMDKRPLIIGGIVALAIVILFGLLGWWLFSNPEATAVLRDIFIIFLGLGVFLVILLLIALIVMTIYLVLKINDLIGMLNREIKPMLAQVQSTLNTARGTTAFLSEQAVKPVITTASAVAGVRAVFRTLFRR